MKNTVFGDAMKNLRKYFSIILVLAIILSMPISVFAQGFTTSSGTELETYIMHSLYNRETEINATFSGSSARLEEVLNGIIHQDPYIKYTLASIRWSYSGYERFFDVTYQAKHLMTLAQENKANQRMDQLLKEIILPELTPHEKVKAVHDWIVLNTAYDLTLTYRTHYDILERGQAVCHGYALLFYRMMEKLDIPVSFVLGNTTEAHIWNKVFLDGHWFHIDVTYNDPVPDVKGRVVYDFYLLTDEQIQETHTIEKDYATEASVSYELLLNKLYERTNYENYRRLISDLGLRRIASDVLAEMPLNMPTPNQVNVFALGDFVPFDENFGFPFIDSNGRTQVPFRMTMEYFGAEVDWEKDTRTAIATLNGIQVRVPIDSPYVYVNGIPQENDTISVIVGNRTYLPIRIVLEAFGFIVDWDCSQRMVLVDRP